MARLVENGALSGCILRGRNRHDGPGCSAHAQRPHESATQRHACGTPEENHEQYSDLASTHGRRCASVRGIHGVVLVVDGIFRKRLHVIS